MKCILFKMPDVLINKLGMEDVESFMHQYIVTENGDLMVPWYDFIDQKQCDEMLTCAVYNDVEYYNATDLMRYGVEEHRDTLKHMVRIMIQFHESRFDKQKPKAES